MFCSHWSRHFTPQWIGIKSTVATQTHSSKIVRHFFRLLLCPLVFLCPVSSSASCVLFLLYKKFLVQSHFPFIIIFRVKSGMKSTMTTTVTAAKRGRHLDAGLLYHHLLSWSASVLILVHLLDDERERGSCSGKEKKSKARVSFTKTQVPFFLPRTLVSWATSLFLCFSLFTSTPSQVLQRKSPDPWHVPSQSALFVPSVVSKCSCQCICRTSSSSTSLARVIFSYLEHVVQSYSPTRKVPTSIPGKTFAYKSLYWLTTRKTYRYRV